MHESARIRMKALISSTPGLISLTTDAWSSRKMKRYVVITAHWIDKDWSMRSIALDFKRFMTPHTGEATCEILLETIDSWELRKRLRSITSDNASDVCSGVARRFANLSLESYVCSSLRNFHVRCIAQDVNLGVEECFEPIRSQMNNIRGLLNSIRTSVKRRDMFANIQVELG